MSDIITDDEASVTITTNTLVSAKDDTMHLPYRNEDYSRHYSPVEKVVKENLSPLETAIKILLLVQTSARLVVEGVTRVSLDTEAPEAIKYTPELLLETIGREIGILKYVARTGWDDPALEDKGQSVAIANWHDYLNEKELLREERRKQKQSSST